MSTTYKADAYVLCPYYCKEDPITVKCFGMCGTHTLHQFESSKAKKEYKENFCMGYYWNCSCYRSLETDGK